MSKKHRIVIEHGVARFVYHDDLAALAAQGTTARASHVEPHPTGPGWLADMRPIHGPILGLNGEFAIEADEDVRALTDGDALIALSGRIVGFPTRQAALDAEDAWLRANEGL